MYSFEFWRMYTPCNHHCNQDGEYFHHPHISFLPVAVPHPYSQAGTDVFLTACRQFTCFQTASVKSPQWSYLARTFTWNGCRFQRRFIFLFNKGLLSFYQASDISHQSSFIDDNKNGDNIITRFHRWNLYYLSICNVKVKRREYSEYISLTFSLDNWIFCHVLSFTEYSWYIIICT